MLYKTMLKYFALFVTLFFTSSAQQISSGYNYPIKPGTDEWKALKTHKEMLAVCQIPQDMLNNMTTEAVVQSCLDFPLFSDMLAYNETQNGFSKVASRFNGLKELLSRKDAGHYLKKKYDEVNPENIDTNWSLIEKGKYAFSINLIEILLAQKEILTQLNNIEKMDLLASVVKKYFSKEKSSQVFGMLHLEINALLQGRILIEINNEKILTAISVDNDLKNFIEKGGRSSTHTIEKILTNTQTILNSQN